MSSKVGGGKVRGFALILFLSVAWLICRGSTAAMAGGLEASLCGRADLLSGQCQKVDSLVAGAKGFTVSLTSRYESSVLVNLAWEPLSQGQAGQSSSLAKDTVILGRGQSKFVPFRALRGGLTPGRFRLVFFRGRPKGSAA